MKGLYQSEPRVFGTGPRDRLDRAQIWKGIAAKAGGADRQKAENLGDAVG